MKGWLYVISNKAVKEMVKVGSTPNDPVAFARALDKSGLPFPHELGYEALLPDMLKAEKSVEAALSARSEGKGWYSCTVSDAVAAILSTVGGEILMDTLYDEQAKTERLYGEASASDPVRRATVLSDPSCPPNVLRFAVERETDESVLVAMLENPACASLGEGIADLADRMSESERVLLAMASNHSLHPDALEAVYWASQEAGSSIEVILSLVRNPRFPEALLWDVASDYNSEEALMPAIVARPDCVPEALANVVYFNPGDQLLREAAKRHPNWSPEVFSDLLVEHEEGCPSCVADHPDCPPEILTRLWRSDDWETKEAVLSNPSCPPSILVEASLAGDAETCSESAIAELAERAMENPSNPLAQAGNASSRLEFETLAGSCFPKVLTRTADNAACPPDVLGTLSRNGNPEVRCAVAGNRSAPPDVLAALACDPCDEIRERVARRSDCSAELIAELAGDGSPFVRRAALRNRVCPVSTLETFAEHELFEWRLVVLENPACPPSLVERLAKDLNHDVRSAAKRILSGAKDGPKSKRAPEEPLEVVRERFRNYVRRTLGALIEESELVRLSALPAEEREKFNREYPSQAKQLALFEKHLLSRLGESGN